MRVTSLRGGVAFLLWSALAVQGTGCRTPAAPRGGLTELWFQAQSGSGFTYSRPEVVGDVVIFGSPSGHVIARDVATGASRWTTPVCGAGGPQARNFVIAAGRVLVACNTEVVAVDVATGAVRWRYESPLDTTYDDLPGFVGVTRPATDGSAFYVPAWGAFVSAVSATTGARLWVWTPGRLATDTAANVFRSGAKGVTVSGDTVFVTMWHWTNLLGGTSEALLVALDRATGAELWKLMLPATSGGGAIATAPLIVGDLAVALTIDGRLYAVRRSTAQLAWQYRSPSYMYGTLAAPVVVGDIVYVSMGDERLTALRADNGSILWSVPPLGATEDLLATGRRIYVPRNGILNIHDRLTGALIATGRVKSSEGGTFTTAAASLGDQIFITSSEGAWSFREPK